MRSLDRSRLANLIPHRSIDTTNELPMLQIPSLKNPTPGTAPTKAYFTMANPYILREIPLPQLTGVYTPQTPTHLYLPASTEHVNSLRLHAMD